MNEQNKGTPITNASAFEAHHRRILIIGRDPQLLRIRAWVLETGAFEAPTTTDLEEAKTTIAGGAVDGLMLCHSLPEAEAESIVRRAAIDRPNMPVLLLTSSALKPPLTVETIDVNKGPRALLAKCAQLFAPASGQRDGH